MKELIIYLLIALLFGCSKKHSEIELLKQPEKDSIVLHFGGEGNGITMYRLTLDGVLYHSDIIPINNDWALEVRPLITEDSIELLTY